MTKNPPLHDETIELQRRIDEAGAAGGGRVDVAPGIHLVRPIELRAGVELHLEEGAVLLARCGTATRRHAHEDAAARSSGQTRPTASPSQAPAKSTRAARPSYVLPTNTNFSGAIRLSARADSTSRRRASFSSRGARASALTNLLSRGFRAAGASGSTIATTFFSMASR